MAQGLEGSRAEDQDNSALKAGAGAGVDDPCGSLPIQDIPRFCDSLSRISATPENSILSLQRVDFAS